MSGHQWTYWKVGLGGLARDEIGPLSEEEFKQHIRQSKVGMDTDIMSPTRTQGQIRRAGDVPSIAKMLGAVARKIEAQKEQSRLDKQAEKARKAEHKRELALMREHARVEQEQREHDLALRESEEEEMHRRRVEHARANRGPSTTVVVSGGQSNAGAIIANLFWPGVGQLIQGRVFSGLLIMGLNFVSILLCFVLIGFFTTPVIWLIAVLDAAWYKPKSEVYSIEH